MEYNFREIEKKWRTFWAENQTYKTEDSSEKPKFYVLDMFPYPSGAGLHVGHPLGYIASDIYARYKKLQGFNVLHPMGYDSFGLPAEQYAIQTGQHPAITTETNINRYRDQLDQMGFSYDWSREVRTSSPAYYKWTQWIFKQIFECYYNSDLDKAMPISELIIHFEKEGNSKINAVHDCEIKFSKDDWNSFTDIEKESVLQNYRLAYLADSWVNWCPALGTVLANDEVINGKSERGNHPVEQKLMRQWSMRIKAYANRLLEDLDSLDWTESIKEVQRNWIGKSVGATVTFLTESGHKIDVFTTRPDTIYGVNFLTLAPEHPFVNKLTTEAQKAAVFAYQEKSALRTERDRMSDVKTISGANTGAFAIHPLSGEKIQIWIGDYVLASYGTGAVMAVPCGDQRDWDFAKHFNIEIKNIFQDQDISEAAFGDKNCIIANSDFITGLSGKEASKKIIEKLTAINAGSGKTNFRLRDAIFSRQRYWGEPFPVFYENGIAKLVADELLPVTLPDVDAYLPTEDGEPPLARAKKEAWNVNLGDGMEFNTMPGWAGSSWYFLRYMDPKNEYEFANSEKIKYWNQVDLYMGGAEHATGHLLYSRFWTKFLYDRNLLTFKEPFKKMINQGMILGRSSIVYRLEGSNNFVSKSIIGDRKVQGLHVDISMVENDFLDIEKFKSWRSDFANATFELNQDGKFECGFEVEKMSKSLFNVQTPDDLIEKFGADTLRMYEMFLGPIEQSKPWDVKGITGVHGFLKRLWRLFFNQDGSLSLSDGEAPNESLKTLHRLIKKMTDDLDRFSFNTGVSNFMIAVNELTEQKCSTKSILEPIIVMLSPYAPHISEELWKVLGNAEGKVTTAQFPKFDESILVENNFEYPVSFNGKMRFKINLPLSLTVQEIEKEIMARGEATKYLEGKSPKKVIVVPGKIVNIVM